ncbi:MAG: hypothetical protein M3Y91_05120 [Actinomycetota bacterium]|nr:hypothetical protein [Actinomycetota bacterium]
MVTVAAVAVSLSVVGCGGGASAKTADALQMRPVEKTSHGSCATGSRTTNPPGASPAELSSLNGDTCFTLGRQVVGFDRAGAGVPSSTGSLASPRLLVTLPAGTSTALNAYAGKHVGDMLAVVMFGKVLEAPQIEAASFNGNIVLTGLTPGQAHMVQTALAP